MRGSSACVFLNAQNPADRSLTFVDLIVSRSGLRVQELLEDHGLADAAVTVEQDAGLPRARGIPE